MIRIEPLDSVHCDALASILSTDERLHKKLHPVYSMKKISAEAFFKTCEQWAEKTNSKCYCILRNNKPIGTLSISHRDLVNKTAQCGYWMESRLWGNGYGTQAFKLALNEAFAMGICKLTCCISKDNKASIALWRKYGAKFTQKGESVLPVLDLSSWYEFVIEK